MADAGQILLGPIGRNVLEFAQLVFFMFATGSHLLTFTVMMNTLTEHGTCSIVFGVVGLVVSYICSLPRTMKNVSWLAFACKKANALRWTNADEIFHNSVLEYSVSRFDHHDWRRRSTSG